ncbi:MAG: FAD binding domain-containing protein, partial [Xanthobacteraceae bacterium]|nr:FAD binding domain-containing protein [Xanthobacteraceae bacterium]
MKPAPFDYVRPASIDEACAALAVEESVVIAGGQTLIPILAMRLARPARLVDIARIPGLAGIREEGDAVVIGATTRQVEAERSAVIAARVPLLARALPFVGHAPTRNRGTLGGSVANADPAAEIPLVLVTLG